MRLRLLPAPRVDKGRKRTFNTMTEDEEIHEQQAMSKHIDFLKMLHGNQGIQILNDDFIIY